MRIFICICILAGLFCAGIVIYTIHVAAEDIKTKLETEVPKPYYPRPLSIKDHAYIRCEIHIATDGHDYLITQSSGSEGGIYDVDHYIECDFCCMRTNQ